MRQLQQEHLLEALSSLSYRTGELSRYLEEIACRVSQLLKVDWSVVTLCQNGFETVLASSLDIGEAEHTYSLHGLLTNTVVQTKRSLIVENSEAFTDYGKAPPGYLAYLGVPLRTPQAEVIGTICSFHKQPRKFTDAEICITEMFAERAATAIDNYHLYQQQQQFNAILEVEVAKRAEELRAAQVKLLEQERLAAIGEFAATIVHEIRNPLTTVMMGLDYFKRVDLSKPSQERLSLAIGEANRLERLLRELLLYAKPHQLQLTEININEFIKDILNTICTMPEARRRRIKFSPTPAQVKIRADKDKLQQVFINIVRNACEAVAEADTVTWSVHNDSTFRQVHIQIHNGGDPIPVDILPRLTEPFYTTKSSGTGLGLAIVKRIVEVHGGDLTIQSTAQDGTTVTVQMPSSEES